MHGAGDFRSSKYFSPAVICTTISLFLKALRCFKNAEHIQRILWAEGSLAESRGKESRAKGQIADFRSHFKEASGYFLLIGMKKRAAGCLEALGEFVAAAGKTKALFFIVGYSLFLTQNSRPMARTGEV